MSKTSCIAAALCVLALGIAAAQPQATQTPAKSGKAPDIGFDYKSMIADHLTLINSGQAEKAVEFLTERAKYPKAFMAGAPEFKKRFSIVYGAAGRPDGHELTGYKRVSSRSYTFYAMGYYENLTIQFAYGFERHNGEWKCLIFGMQDNIDEMLKGTPLQAIDDK